MKSTQSNFSIFLIVSMVLIGFLGGVVGELWVNSFLLPDPYLKFKSYSDLSNRINELVNNQQNEQAMSSRDKVLTEAIAKAKPSLVDIYRFRDLSKSPNSSFLPNDWLGFGSVITSDGWILTSRETIKSPSAVFVRLADGKLIKAEKIVLPKDSEVSFIKIEKTNLDVVNFNLRRDLTDGSEVLVFDNVGAMVRGIQNKSFNEISLERDLIHLSEEPYRQILLSGEETISSGRPVFSLEGKMLGVVANGGKTIWPMENFLPIMKAVIKNQEWQRPYLGLKFFDLSEFINPNSTDKTGIKIIADGVAYNSPARQKLIPGDIIKKVENDELNENKSLPEVLADYPAKSSLRFLINREGQEKEIIIDLP